MIIPMSRQALVALTLLRRNRPLDQSPVHRIHLRRQDMYNLSLNTSKVDTTRLNMTKQAINRLQNRMMLTGSMKMARNGGRTK